MSAFLLLLAVACVPAIAGIPTAAGVPAATGFRAVAGVLSARLHSYLTIES